MGLSPQTAALGKQLAITSQEIYISFMFLYILSFIYLFFYIHLFSFLHCPWHLAPNEMPNF